MLWGGRWKMWCVYVSLCRGVLNTPYRRPIYGANDPNDRSLIRILVPCGAILWGVCHTPLPCYPKNDHGRGIPLDGICKTRRHAGLLLPDMAPLICVRPILFRSFGGERLIVKIKSLGPYRLGISKIRLSFNQTFCRMITPGWRKK